MLIETLFPGALASWCRSRASPGNWRSPILRQSFPLAADSRRLPSRRFGTPCYTGGLRRLIINADDFAFTSGVNRAIIEAHTRGVVTSSTLMANGAAFDEAVSLAKSTPTLSIGCHVVLIDGEPVLEPAKIPSLTESCRFRNGLGGFAARALAGRMAADRKSVV